MPLVGVLLINTPANAEPIASLFRDALATARASPRSLAFHQKGTVSRGEQTVRQSAPRAVKSHIACSAFVTRCIEAMLRASWKKTVGYCWRTQKCRLVG